MTDEPEEEEGDRTRNNIVVGIAAIVLIVVGVILMRALSHDLKVQDCIAAGHRDCSPVDTGH